MIATILKSKVATEVSVFHSGASFKDLGKECFAINEIENTKEVEKIMENIKNLI